MNDDANDIIAGYIDDVIRLTNDLDELKAKYEKLFSIIKDMVHVLDNNLDIQPNSAIHHCAKDYLKQIGEE